MRGTVLVVDDNLGIRKFLHEFLKLEGYSVLLAADGYKAIETVKKTIPSLIILDIKMPGLSGYEVLRHLKQLAHGIPIILLSAYSEENKLTEILKDNPSLSYIRKPFDLNILRDLIKTIPIKKLANL